MENENRTARDRAHLDLHAEVFALKVAFVTLAKTQPIDIKKRFSAAYLPNLRTMCDLALATENPDTWIALLEQHGARLQELIEK